MFITSFSIILHSLPSEIAQKLLMLSLQNFLTFLEIVFWKVLKHFIFLSWPPYSCSDSISEQESLKIKRA